MAKVTTEENKKSKRATIRNALIGTAVIASVGLLSAYQTLDATVRTFTAFAEELRVAKCERVKVEDIPIFDESGINIDTAPTDYNTGTSSNPIYLQNFYSTQYFYNLKENFGYNKYGSCGYIAAGMLLSYYDTYWNDSIVAEAYEQRTEISATNLNEAFRASTAPYSPGSKNDYALMCEMSDYSLYQYLYTENEDELQFKLMYLAHYYDLADFTLPLSSSSFGINYVERTNILNQYFNENSLNCEANFEANSHYKEAASSAGNTAFFQKIISKIKSGIPVILSIGNLVEENGELQYTNGHSVIAYDYNENASNALDGIYVHPGWYTPNYPAYTSTHQSISSLNRDVILAYSYIDVKTTPHSCSNNYYKYSASYCSCELGCHSNHVHQAVSDGYTECNDEQHYINCYCGDTVLEDHTLTGIVNNNWMCAYCPHCGYLKQLYEIGI